MIGSRLLALALAFGMMPGSVGVVEDAVHVVDVGHLADVHPADRHHAVLDQDGLDRAVPDPDDRGPSDEHGCSGVFHTCSCHVAPVFVQAHIGWRLDAPLARDVGGAWLSILRRTAGVPAAVDRPPIA